MGHPQVKVRTWQAHRIPCPYCTLGHGVLRISSMGGEVQGNLAEPIKCRNPVCGKEFMVKAQLKFTGVTMEQAAQPLPRRNGYVGGS